MVNINYVYRNRNGEVQGGYQVAYIVYIALSRTERRPVRNQGQAVLEKKSVVRGSPRGLLNYSPDQQGARFRLQGLSRPVAKEIDFYNGNRG